jgi:hypothetical protein
MLGVQLLVSQELLQHAHVHTRFDPPRGLAGRCGGLRVVSRQQGSNLDELFITAYAPQATDDLPQRNAFFLAILEMMQAVPRRTRIWLLGDFNGHVGSDLQSAAVGRHTAGNTNNNGFSLVHACDANSLVLSNTFFGGGNTWWSPDGQTAHCLDFIAIPADCRSRVKKFQVNNILGRRWQMSLVRDHWPVELTVQLVQPWQRLPLPFQPTRWNKHALQTALEDPGVGNAFLQDLQHAWAPLRLQFSFVSNTAELEAHWNKVRNTMHAVAAAHFGMRPAQRSMKLLPATFDLLRAKRHQQHALLAHFSHWETLQPSQTLRWFFSAWILTVQHMCATRRAAAAVKHDNALWDRRLEARLCSAESHHDAREAWSVCRQLAGHGPGRIIDRAAPAAQYITEQQWLQHMGDLWGAWRCFPEVVLSGVQQPTPFFEPLLEGEEGRAQFFAAAKSQKRFRATPQGAIPAELWQLLLDKRELAGPSQSWAPEATMEVFEAFQRFGYNPQPWCDGQGCPLPKPGGLPGPAGQRLINLLDPGGKLFYKALLGLARDVPADHQYGYAAKRSRRDAILQVEAWLDRLRKNKLSTATTLYDLTKAFDTLNMPSIAQTIQQGPYPPLAMHLLLDLHHRLRIRLTLQDGADPQVKLESGVLQGGGTGPRLFREAFDDCVSTWIQNVQQEITVLYQGQRHFPGVAAYADDLIRICSGRNLIELQNKSREQTASLQQLLTPKGLKLNSNKGETLLQFSGKGAYNAAKAAFSGDWRGYPLRLTVKYLGSRLQDNGGLEMELQKRIASAKASFAKFVTFFRRCRVPLRRKAAVFRAVVNETLLSALEVRPLSPSDEHKLEQARGLLLRRLFGRDGFGVVSGDPVHRSVTLESLRQRAGISTVSSDLKVRRLLWLRSALLAESHGQTRLELATLFGDSPDLGPSVNGESGAPTTTAPRFLHILHRDLASFWADFPGFRGNWKILFLNLPCSSICALRTPDVPEAPEEAADQPAEAPVDLVQEIRCDQCGAGPWKSERALRSHKIQKHNVRHRVQSRQCPLCNRVFTTKTAAQRHFDNSSCGTLVCNHGHGGALEGQRRKEAALAPAQVPAVPAAPPQQARLDRFFAVRNGPRLSAARRQPDGNEASEEGQRPRDGHSLGGAGASRASSSRASGAASESLPASRQSRPISERTRRLVYSHVAVGQRQRTGQDFAGAHGNVEEQASASGSAASSRACPPHGGRSSGQMVDELRGSTPSHAQVREAARADEPTS